MHNLHWVHNLRWTGEVMQRKSGRQKDSSLQLNITCGSEPPTRCNGFEKSLPKTYERAVNSTIFHNFQRSAQLCPCGDWRRFYGKSFESGRAKFTIFFHWNFIQFHINSLLCENWMLELVYRMNHRLSALQLKLSSHAQLHWDAI